MAEANQKQTTTIPQPPVINPGIVGDVNSVTLSGTERLGNVNVLPPVNVLPGAENVVRVESQPGDEIPMPIESPVPAPEKTVEINRAPSGSAPTVGQIQEPAEEVVQTLEETKSDNPKVMSIEKARKIAEERRKSLMPPTGGENADDYIAELEVIEEEREAA